MSYKLEWKASPNFTPGNQTQAFYGRPRAVSLGAGHWWGDPNAGYGHDGVVNGFLNSARQVAAHAVVSAGRVTEMVRPGDTAWCTSSANPYTYAIEVDPRMFKGGALAEQIMATLAEYIADRPMVWFGNIEWRSHKALVGGTECNPLDWGEIRRRANVVWAQKHAPAPPAVPEWKKNLQAISPTITLFAIDDQTPLRNLANTAEVIKNFSKGTPFEIAGKTKVGDYPYYLTKYAYENNTGQGFDFYELKPADPPAPVVPEWQRNLRTIDPVKLMVLPAQTPIVDLNTLKPIKQLGQGTWVDFTKLTTVAGVEYLLSSYSATNGMPNGILRADVGLPVTQPEPPVMDKPEWVKNWRDVSNVTMYTRVDAALVNLLDGSTIKTIPRGTAVQIDSATEWHGQQYLISEYATAAKAPNGILVVDLSDKPLEPNPAPVEPAPTQPDLDARVTILEQFMQAVKALLAKIGINI